MKPRTPQKPANDTPGEFKGVVKRIAGRLTNDPELARQGDDEMEGTSENARKRGASRSQGFDPDPHRRG